MTTQFDLALNSALERLKSAVKSVNKPGNLDGLLVYHLDTRNRLGGDFSWNVYNDPIAWLQQSHSSLDQAPDLAVLGFLLDQQYQKTGFCETDAIERFQWGVERIKQRRDIFSLPNSWAMQPVIVLGICLGILTTKSASGITWMQTLANECLKRSNITRLVKLSYYYVQSILNRTSENKLKIDPDESSATFSLSELAFAIWLVRSDLVDVKGDKQNWLKSAYEKLVEKILKEPYEGDDYKAGIILITASDYIEIQSRIPDFDLVVSLLDNFLPSMERWREKWIVEDEYDVQSLLWLILRSSFNSVKYEEFLPKFGRSSERFDIGIPELGLIIEAKYTRKPSDLQKIVEEIGKDVAQLQPQTTYRNIIAFVYDESCSTEKHGWVKHTLEGIPEVKKAIIVAAPAICRPSMDISPKRTRTKRKY